MDKKSEADAIHGPRFTVRHLGIVEPPVLNGGRIHTAAGNFVQIANGDEFRFLAYLDFAEKGVRRGGHVHSLKTERLYVIQGRLEATYVDVDTDAGKSVQLAEGDLVEVAPGCAHSYLASEYTQALEFATHAYDPGDTAPYDFGA